MLCSWTFLVVILFNLIKISCEVKVMPYHSLIESAMMRQTQTSPWMTLE